MIATDFINELTPNAIEPIAIAALLIHRRTGEERHIDILCNDGSFATVTKAIRKHFDFSWGLFETWEISDGSDNLSRYLPVAA